MKRFAAMCTVFLIAADRDNLAQKGEPTLKRAKEFGLSAEDMRGTEIALPARSQGEFLIPSNVREKYLPARASQQ
jgi:hypothetical protein